jgi:hypothetical protein
LSPISLPHLTFGIGIWHSSPAFGIPSPNRRRFVVAVAEKTTFLSGRLLRA